MAEFDFQSVPNVQLGIVEKRKKLLFEDKDWSKWDGGKIGGDPCWLDPENHPKLTDYECTLCHQAMNFLLQIYCPLDEPISAFHRCLYVFICKDLNCVSSGSVRCFRQQLSQRNKYYPYEINFASEIFSENKTCVICKCKTVNYCCKEHQKQDWSKHKVNCRPKKTQISSTNQSNISKLPEYGLSVKDEYIDDSDNNDSNIDINKIKPWSEPDMNGVDNDIYLSQNDFNKAAGLADVDATYDKFLSRILKGDQKQVLRYSRWPSYQDMVTYKNGPLLISENANKNRRCYKLSGLMTHQLTELSKNSKDLELSESNSKLSLEDMENESNRKINDSSLNSCCIYNPDEPSHEETCLRCSYCGNKRLFECQIMPQLLYYLGVDKETTFNNEQIEPTNTTQKTSAFLNQKRNDIDFGTLDIYTCPSSCKNEKSNGYYEETVFVIPPPDIYIQH